MQARGTRGGREAGRARSPGRRLVQPRGLGRGASGSSGGSFRESGCNLEEAFGPPPACITIYILYIYIYSGGDPHTPHRPPSTPPLPGGSFIAFEESPRGPLQLVPLPF